MTTSISSRGTLEYRYLETNGVTLHVVQSGDPQGEPVLMLHGFPEFWYGWRHQIPALAQAGFRVWTPDQRGYNLSSKPKDLDAYRMKALVADVISLIDQMGVEKVNLVGHDWGGAVAWAVAIRYPERLKKLAILNIPHPAVFLRHLRESPHQMLKSWYMAFFQLPLLPEAFLLAGDANGAANALMMSANKGTFSDSEIAEYIKAWKRPGAMTGMLNWYRALGRNPGTGLSQSGGSGRIQVPTRILWGTNDIALSAEMAQPSVEMCDQGELFTFEDAGHWIAHEKPDEVNQHLIEFFKA